MALSPDVVVVAPGELITSAHINNIRANLVNLDTGKFNATGGVISGNVTIQTLDPSLYFYDLAALRAYVRYVGGDLTLSSVGGVRTVVGGADRFRILSTGLILFHKFNTDPQTPGVEIAGLGAVSITQSVAAVNSMLYKNGAAVGSGQVYEQYFNAAASVGGVVLAAGLNGVSYSTTSDKRLKTLTRPVDPGEALDRLNRAEPVNFLWSDNPGAGEQLGFFAQDLYTVAPEAVTPGHGEPGDVADPADPAGTGFLPWMVDHSALVPTLVAAVQALTRRVADLEARIQALEATPA